MFVWTLYLIASWITRVMMDYTCPLKENDTILIIWKKTIPYLLLERKLYHTYYYLCVSILSNYLYQLNAKHILAGKSSNLCLIAVCLGQLNCEWLKPTVLLTYGLSPVVCKEKGGTGKFLKRRWHEKEQKMDWPREDERWNEGIVREADLVLERTAERDLLQLRFAVGM